MSTWPSNERLRPLAWPALVGTTCVVRSRQGPSMSLSVRTVEYFYVRIAGSPEKAYELLAQLASEEVNLLAFSAVPYGPSHVELTIFPDWPENLLRAADKLVWTITGPQ